MKSLKFHRKVKRSAGVLVTPQVHRLIAQGNAARARRDWSGAADAYAEAVRIDPSLRHIWLQLGHMLKEAARTDEAIAAYESALALAPNDPEPIVHVAHIHKTRGDTRAAASSFLRAIRTGDGDETSVIEFGEIVGRIRPTDPLSLSQAARHAPPSRLSISEGDPTVISEVIDRALSLPDALGENAAATLESARALLDRISKQELGPHPGNKQGIVFDVTDLIAHFRHHRLPTGIQRVQIEVVTRALRDPTLDTRVCCFVNARDELLGIPGPLFIELAMMSTASKDDRSVEWSTLMARLSIHLTLADPFTFRQRDTLVNLGTSWWVYNYFLLLRKAKRDYSIRYIPFVHDLIPIMATDHCVKGVVEDYVCWLVGVFDHADFFLVNSRSTGDDLLRVAGHLGRHINDDVIEVVPLDADFRQSSTCNLSQVVLERWNLRGGGGSIASLYPR